MKASPEAQLRLLELADLDAELGRLRAPAARTSGTRRAGPAGETGRQSYVTRWPQRSRAGRPPARRSRPRPTSSRRGPASTGTASGWTAEVSSPRELENLAVRDRVPGAQAVRSRGDRSGCDGAPGRGAGARREAALSEREEIAANRESVTARRDAALGEIGEQAGKASDRRAAVAGEEPQDLLDLYERRCGSSTAGSEPRPCAAGGARLPPLPEHRRPEQHQGRRPGRGAALRGVPQVLVRTPESGL